MKDLNARIQQLTKLILTSQTVTEEPGSLSRPSSPVKIDFDMEPYQLQQELLAARYQLESQANQILSLESALIGQKPESSESTDSASDPFSVSSDQQSALNDKDAVIAEQAKRIKELEADSVVSELKKKLEDEVQKREEKERWSKELERALEKEKKMRVQLEEERRALAAFVSMFDSLGLGGLTQSAASTPTASPVKPSGPPTSSDPTSSQRFPKTTLSLSIQEEEEESTSSLPQTIPLPHSPPSSPARSLAFAETDVGPSLLDEEWGYIDHGDISFEHESLSHRQQNALGALSAGGKEVVPIADKLAASMGLKGRRGKVGGVGSKENLPIS
jgi:centromeric protein E